MKPPSPCARGFARSARKRALKASWMPQGPQGEQGWLPLQSDDMARECSCARRPGDRRFDRSHTPRPMSCEGREAGRGEESRKDARPGKGAVSPGKARNDRRTGSQARRSAVEARVAAKGIRDAAPCPPVHEECGQWQYAAQGKPIGIAALRSPAHQVLCRAGRCPLTAREWAAGGNAKSFRKRNLPAILEE